MPSTRRRFGALAAGLTIGTLVATLPLARSAPTCTTAPQAACGNRVIAEPLHSATFIQYDLELPDVLHAIEAISPGFVEVKPLADWLGKPFASAGGRELWVTRVTDESVPAAGKRQVALSLSIHGNEPAGREGGLRYLEDLAHWSVDDKTHTLYAGDNAFPLDDVLKHTEIYFGLLNPDGWSKGDVSGGFVGERANANGTDLNRQFPTLGWTQREHMTDPEAIGWSALLDTFPDFTSGTDIHGELNSANNAFADVMWPAAQWMPHKLAAEHEFGLDMVGTVNRKFAEYQVPAAVIFNPASVATGYDVVGYDDSGFMGDWFAQRGATEIDVENFVSHSAPGSVWIGALEQAHVAAVRGIVEATIAESMRTKSVRAKLDLGRVAYVFDPQRFTAAEKPGQKGYDVSRMRYFEDLARDAGVAVTPIDAADVATTDLTKFDSLVLADMTVPADAKGRHVNELAYIAALKSFANGGGQLVLTDRSALLLPRLGFFADENGVQQMLTNAGHVDFGTLDHPWEDGINPAQHQTYYEVPLGFPATDFAPHYGVPQDAWEAAGGVTVGTIGADSAAPVPGLPGGATAPGLVDLGQLPMGNGSIALFGAVLPTQNIEENHPNGLADYAVTVAGGTVMQNILSFKRAGAPAPEPAPEPAPVTPPKPQQRPGSSLPATGANTSWLPVVLVALAAATRQLRRRTR